MSLGIAQKDTRGPIQQGQVGMYSGFSRCERLLARYILGASGVGSHL